MKAIIMAGGRGTRLRPYTKVFPKPLVPIGGTSTLELLIQQLRRDGVEHVILAVGPRAKMFETQFGDGSRYGIRIDYQFEKEPLGTVGAIAQAPRSAESFLVANGDILTTLDFKSLVSFHRESGATATIAVQRRSWEAHVGVIELNGDYTIRSFREKPVHHYLANMGVYVLEPRAIDYIAPCEYSEFPSLVESMLESGEKVGAFLFEGYWRDVGNSEDYQQAQEDFRSMQARFRRA